MKKRGRRGNRHVICVSCAWISTATAKSRPSKNQSVIALSVLFVFRDLPCSNDVICTAHSFSGRFPFGPTSARAGGVDRDPRTRGPGVCDWHRVARGARRRRRRWRRWRGCECEHELEANRARHRVPVPARWRCSSSGGVLVSGRAIAIGRESGRDLIVAYSAARARAAAAQ